MRNSARKASTSLEGRMAMRKARKIWVNEKVSRRLMPRMTCGSSAMNVAPFPANLWDSGDKRSAAVLRRDHPTDGHYSRGADRSEERRGGEEGRDRWAPHH